MDSIWKETGMDERDYVPNLIKHGMENDESISKTLLEYNTLFEQFVKAKKDEMEAR